MLLLTQVVLLVATILSPSYGDVKHVLEGSARPPQHVHTNECQHIPFIPPGYQGSSSNAVSGSGQYWWAENDAAFKQAYEYFKRCSEKGNCFLPVASSGCNPTGCAAASTNVLQIKTEQKTVDISKNPFLNGQISAQPPPSGCTGSQCSSGSGQIDISKNPFLNGNIGAGNQPSGQGCGNLGCSPGNVVIPQPPPKPDYSKNPFLNGGTGQTAFSGSGQAINIGSSGFLGVQPSEPFGNNNNKNKPLNNNYPNLQPNKNAAPVPTDNQIANPSSPDTEDSAAAHPCIGADETCVAPEFCINGVISSDGSGIIDRRHSNDHCESENKVCCRVPVEATTTKSNPSNIGSDDSSISDAPADYPSRSSENIFPNLYEIKNGKKPGSVIQFQGGLGISPGSIQIISDNEAIPKPQVSNSGESGSGIIQSATSEAPIFASTPDYSNEDLSHISFVSTIHGPQYLPPFLPQQPSERVPEIVIPSISTYQPVISTTPKPVSKPIIPGPSVVSIHSEPTPAPFVPSVPQPFVPIPQLPPRLPEIEVLPQTPLLPKPFVPQPPIEVIPYPSQPEPIIPQGPIIIPHPPQFVQPKPEIINVYEPSTPLVTFDNRNKPSELPSISTVPNEKPGYKYPTPTPPFVYPSPSTPKPSISINDNFIPIKIKPTPKPYKPQPTPGYEYKKPTPSFPLPTQKPFNPQPQPSGGYEYKKPTPSFPTPPPIIKVTSSGYLPPNPNPKPYNPQPSDSFESTKVVTIPVPPPTIKVTNNQYLPPQPNRIPDGSNTNEFFVSKPSVSPPTHEGQPDVPIPDIVKFPRPLQPSPANPIPNVANLPKSQPSLPQGGCAAALKCVQEIYCTADGVISPVPVILTKAQQLARVPTTECTDREAGIIGRCCRDPNYVDPWPSANSLNGFDDGQYREDPNLGKYFPQDQRGQRSEIRANTVKVPLRARSNVAVETGTSARSNAILDVNFNTQSRSTRSNEVAFAEIPWQAMILRDSTRKLLCGGVIVKPNAVLTSAQCVEGLPTSDILIKGGEWKLGIDEEPLPFQIVKVAAIIRHPSYRSGNLQYDLALLMLEENLRIAKNVAPIALASNTQIQKQKCIATGWGKRILQVHLRGAIMKAIDVNILDNKQCGEVIQDRYKNFLSNYFSNTICGFSKSDQCDVDYGSALACSTGNGIYSLAGIFSWDTGCKDDGQIGGYIPPDFEWIETTCSQPLNQLIALDRKYNSQY